MSEFSGSTLHINLPAVRENYNILRSQLPAGCSMSAVVKANAYGLGDQQVVGALTDEGCRDFFVANLDEAIKIRKAYKLVNIYVFAGVFAVGEADIFCEYNIRPVLNDFYQLELFADACAKRGQLCACAIMFDSAMNRLGFAVSDADRILQYMDKVDVKLLLTHLACADQGDHELNKKQLTAAMAIKSHFPEVSLSVANSSGIFLGHEFCFDMVRPGSALYGVNPTIGKNNPMRTVVTLTSKILQIREIDRGSTVGYGASYVADRDIVAGVLPVGYADGYFRCLSDVARGFIGGGYVPVIGRVSMDLLVVDLTDIASDGQVNVGDQVELLGDNIKLDDLAGLAGTIGYEVLVSLDGRYDRVYSG